MSAINVIHNRAQGVLPFLPAQSRREGGPWGGLPLRARPEGPLTAWSFRLGSTLLQERGGATSDGTYIAS